MNLTKADKAFIKAACNEDDAHIAQIEEAIGKTWFTYKHERISAKRAIDLCGRKRFLIAMARSAFHWTTSVTLDDASVVYFNSAKLFTGRWPRKENR